MWCVICQLLAHLCPRWSFQYVHYQSTYQNGTCTCLCTTHQLIEPKKHFAPTFHVVWWNVLMAACNWSLIQWPGVEHGITMSSIHSIDDTIRLGESVTFTLSPLLKNYLIDAIVHTMYASSKGIMLVEWLASYYTDIHWESNKLSNTSSIWNMLQSWKCMMISILITKTNILFSFNKPPDDLLFVKSELSNKTNLKSVNVILQLELKWLVPECWMMPKKMPESER